MTRPTAASGQPAARETVTSPTLVVFDVWAAVLIGLSTLAFAVLPFMDDTPYGGPALLAILVSPLTLLFLLGAAVIRFTGRRSSLTGRTLLSTLALAPALVAAAHVLATLAS